MLYTTKKLADNIVIFSSMFLASISRHRLSFHEQIREHQKEALFFVIIADYCEIINVVITKGVETSKTLEFTQCGIIFDE